MKLSYVRQSVILYLITLVAFICVAVLQPGPGYMDADYYYHNAIMIASGNIDGEPFLWNYLSEQSDLPGSAFLYWMPMTSLITAIGILLSGGDTFFGARFVLLLIAAFVPVMSGLLCREIGGNTKQSLLAGFFAMVPGFYLAFLTTTDAFAIYMVIGGLYLLIINQALKYPSKWWIWGGMGVAAGIMHLSRADGILWLIVGLGVLVRTKGNLSLIRFLLAFLAASAGYLFVMAPWYWRNWNEFLSVFPPGSSKTLWLTNYDEFFSYPSSNINIHSWLSSGWYAILRARAWALFQNFQTVIAVQGLIFLSPLIFFGLYESRKENIVRFGCILWVMLLGIMSFVWPFPGARGSFYHSAAGVQTLFWASIPIGMEKVISWAAIKRGWDYISAFRFFSISFLVMSFTLTVYLTYNHLDLHEPNYWGSEITKYAQIESTLITLDPSKASIVMVNNPPGFTLATNRPSIVIPSGDSSAMMSAAEQFGAQYLVLEKDTNHPEIYINPQSDPRFEYLYSIHGSRIFRINPQP